MFKKLLFTCTAAVFAYSGMKAQLNYSDVHFWIGSGPDTTLMLMDFQDGTADSSYLWGYAYNYPATGEQLLNAVAAADVNLNINIDTLSFGNFLQDASYHRHQGLGGNPDYWGTWTANTLHLDSMNANMGIGDTLVPGGMFGLSYMDFNPSIAPGNPWAAYNPAAFTFADVQSWYGTGSDSAVVIVDFNNGTDTASFAWGFRFNDSLDAVAMMDSLAFYNADLSVNSSGAFYGINYKNLSAGPTALNDWYTWTATNWGNWEPHYTNSPMVKPGNMLAFTYTKQMKLKRPYLPQSSSPGIYLAELSKANYSFYPNPAHHVLNLEGDFSRALLYNSSGQVVKSSRAKTINLSELAPGLYLLQFENGQQTSPMQKLIIR